MMVVVNVIPYSSSSQEGKEGGEAGGSDTAIGI